MKITQREREEITTAISVLQQLLNAAYNSDEACVIIKQSGVDLIDGESGVAQSDVEPETALAELEKSAA